MFGHLWRGLGGSKNQTRFGVIVPTGSLQGSACYDTAQQAVDAYFGGLPSSTTTLPTGQTVSVTYHKVLNSWFQFSQTTSKTGVLFPPIQTNVTATAPVFIPCFTAGEQYQEGLALGFAIAWAMLIPWAVAMLKKGLI